MGFKKKTWKARIVEFPARRKLEVTATDKVYDVSRSEGAIIEEGDGFTADNMNNLEERIAKGFTEQEGLYNSLLALFPTTAQKKSVSATLTGGSKYVDLYTAESECLVSITGYVAYPAGPAGAALTSSIYVDSTPITSIVTTLLSTGCNMPVQAKIRMKKGQTLKVQMYYGGAGNITPTFHYLMGAAYINPEGGEDVIQGGQVGVAGIGEQDDTGGNETEQTVRNETDDASENKTEDKDDVIDGGEMPAIRV